MCWRSRESFGVFRIGRVEYALASIDPQPGRNPAASCLLTAIPKNETPAVVSIRIPTSMVAIST